MNDYEIMQELNIVLAYLGQNENTFLFNKVQKVIEGLEFYFGNSEYYAKEIRNIINQEK